MGGGVSKVNRVTMSFHTKDEDVVKQNSVMYCNVEREDFKLNSEILKSMEKFNKFSKDEEADDAEEAKR